MSRMEIHAGGLITAGVCFNKEFDPETATESLIHSAPERLMTNLR